MAKIEDIAGGQTPDTPPKAKKRKLKHTQSDTVQSQKAESPTTKFNRMQISAISKRLPHHHLYQFDHLLPIRRTKNVEHHSTTNHQLVTTTNATRRSASGDCAASSSASLSLSSSSGATLTMASDDADVFRREGEAPKKKNAKKRKAKKNAQKRAAKKSKTDGGDKDDADDGDHNDDDDDDDDDVEHQEELYEPTNDELRAADLDGNKPKIVTTRQLKRDKNAKVRASAKVSAAQRERLRDVEYLCQWRDNRAGWKYSKLRQVSVFRTLFVDADPLPDDMWQVAMEYLCGTVGRMRQLMRDAAQKVIDSTDERMVAEKDASLVGSLNYARARTFLQTLE